MQSSIAISYSALSDVELSHQPIVAGALLTLLMVHKNTIFSKPILIYTCVFHSLTVHDVRVPNSLNWPKLWRIDEEQIFLCAEAFALLNYLLLREGLCTPQNVMFDAAFQSIRKVILSPLDNSSSCILFYYFLFAQQYDFGGCRRRCWSCWNFCGIKWNGPWILSRLGNTYHGISIVHCSHLAHFTDFSSRLQDSFASEYFREDVVLNSRVFQ